MIYVDLDDFCEDVNFVTALHAVKKKIPNFKVTLFTIVGRCSDSFIEDIKKIDWLDLVPHGFLHNDSYECKNWSFDRASKYLIWLERFNLTKGFKAPGWQISDEMYVALLKHRYWIADQAYNDQRRPMGLKVYKLDSPNKIHGHLGHRGGYNANELSLIMPSILEHKDKEFGFIKDAV